MNLIQRITIRLSVFLMALLSIWTVLFYLIIVDEVYDETDDLLEVYSESIITRALSGEELPMKYNDTNNSYHIRKISSSYASRHNGLQFRDEVIYVKNKGEDEPARVLRTIYKNRSNQYFELMVAVPTIENAELIQTILFLIIFLYIILMLSITGVNYWILRQSFHPLYALLTWLNNYAINKAIAPMNNDTPIPEFQKLNEAILQSARRNAEMYKQQKLFIGHASHEMQTPLAICKNRLELMMNEPGVNEKQLSEILKTKESLEQLIRLNKTLLLLTKIDNQQFPETSPVILNNVIQNLVTDFSEVYAYLGITINIREEAEPVLQLNDVLTTVLMSNLLKNAFIHNRRHGTIDIRISGTSLQISNTGGDKALPGQEIFKRFYQGTKKAGSTGLGLALADSICKHYHILISYRFTGSMHQFELKF